MHRFDKSIEAAKNVLQKALVLTKDPVKKLEVRGQIALLEERWNEARDYFEDVLEKDPNNLPALAGAGISEREIGKYSRFLNRIQGLILSTNWDASRRYFDRVIKKDSTFEDVLYQYALLHRYEGNFAEALKTARAQVRCRPEILSSQLGLFQLYKSFIVNMPPTKVAELLRENPTEYATFFLAEISRRQGLLDQAEAVFRELLKLPLEMPLPPIYLALARIYYQREQPDIAERYFWLGVNEASTKLGHAILFEELKYILTDEELSEYATLDSTAEKGKFIRSFWVSKNPTPGSRINPRLTEHYRRLLHAEREFAFDGFRTSFNNPDKLSEFSFPKAYFLNNEFNDKGLICLRQGIPDRTQFHANPDAQNSSESWFYEPRDGTGPMIFHFTMEGSMSNNWRLVKFPADMRAWEDLSVWDPKFYRLLHAGQNERERIGDEIKKETEKTVLSGLSSDRQTWKTEIQSLAIPFSVDAFRREGGNALIDFSYAIPLSPLARAIADLKTSLYVEVGTSIVNANHEVLVNEVDTIVVPLTRRSSGALISLFRTTLSPSTYDIGLFVRPLGTNMLGSVKLKKRIPDFSKPGLKVSDLQLLLPSPERTTIEIQGIKVGPSPLQVYPTNKPVYLYFHVYNLVKDDSAKTAYRAQCYLKSITTNEPPLLIAQSEKTGTDESIAEFFILDLANINPGTYMLSVLVTDRKIVQSVTATKGVRLYKP